MTNDGENHTECYPATKCISSHIVLSRWIYLLLVTQSNDPSIHSSTGNVIRSSVGGKEGAYLEKSEEKIFLFLLLALQWHLDFSQVTQMFLKCSHSKLHLADFPAVSFIFVTLIFVIKNKHPVSFVTRWHLPKWTRHSFQSHSKCHHLLVSKHCSTLSFAWTGVSWNDHNRFMLSLYYKIIGEPSKRGVFRGRLNPKCSSQCFQTPVCENVFKNMLC